jgi:hypothetical protein
MVTIMTERPSVSTRCTVGRRAARAAAALIVLAAADPAFAQLDPLLFLKRTQPNVVFVVDTAERMQSDADGTYYDPAEYLRGQAFDVTLGVTFANTAARYRRRYESLQFLNSGGDKYSTSRITIQGDLEAGYSSCLSPQGPVPCGSASIAVPLFYARSRLAVAKAAMLQAMTENQRAVRFGLIRMRQDSPAVKDESPILSTDANQQSPFPTEFGSGRWKMKRGYTNQRSATLEPPSSGLLVQTGAATAYSDISTILNRPLTAPGSLLAAGQDEYSYDDAALAHMLDDAKLEAQRLIGADTQCRNTVVVLIAGGGEGTSGHVPSAESLATGFKNISGRRVPIYVIGVAPPADAQTQLRNIALNSGGRYFEITKEQIATAAAAGVPVAEAVRAIHLAVQHAFANPSDVNTAPTVTQPYGPQSEFQVTSPIVGTANLRDAKYADGSSITDGRILSATGSVVPQRSNLMVTSGLALPNFDGRLRGFRVYKPVADPAAPSGYKFVSDGKALWTARPPTLADGVTPDEARRNIYTVHPTSGAIIPFTTANAGALAPYLNTYDPTGLITFVRSQPIGAIVGSTPAILDAPSVDPPPDADYPKFMDDNKDRRSLVFVGANDGMLHAFDAITGREVWAFIPFNLLPKLKTLRDGQGIDGFDYFVDSSPKVADVKVDHDKDGDVEWRSYLFIGEGPGGTFYQALDVTLDGMGSSVPEYGTNYDPLLTYFSDKDRIPFRWSFPGYSKFDYTVQPYGELSFAAPYNANAVDLSVGETWSDPAVGQAVNQEGRFIMLTGSGFLSRSREQTWFRNGVAAGTTFYMLDAGDGSVLDSEQVPSDNFGETVSNCAAFGDCRNIKNALQADPVATGPPDSRFITKAYLGDLDGNVWRFDIGNDGASPPAPSLTGETKIFTAGRDHPLFASMAAVTVGTQQYLFFGSGSDLLPSAGVNYSYKLFGVLEGSSQPTFEIPLTKIDGAGDDEKVSAFPAVAGDIVFFTTTSFKPASPCSSPDANLYAFTFIGGAAYDSTGDNKVVKNESPKVKVLAGAGRATAPFIVDQHLWFGAGGKISMFGDPQDFNNGVGQVGVRILSWRQLR